MAEIVFECDNCKARMQVGVLASHVWYDREQGEPETRYHFGHCVGCRRPAVVGQEVYGRTPGDHEITGEFPVYPEPSRTLGFPVPPLVLESYNEAVQCEAAGVLIATAVMVRRTLEAVGKDFDPQARNLFGGLETMKAAGVISAELWEWSNQLRFLGNIGAHPTGEKPGRDDVKDAMDFLQAIIETIYHYRPRFQAMKARRAGAAAVATAPPASTPLVLGAPPTVPLPTT